MTNRERLDEMSNKELFEALELHKICPNHWLDGPCRRPYLTCEECWIAWLEAEAES